MFFEHNEQLVLPKNKKVKGIILSGGRGNPYEPLNLTTNFVAMMNFDVPTIGFCLGHEVIASAYMGKISKLPAYQSKKQLVDIIKPDDPIFKGLEKEEIYLREQHAYHVSVLPKHFVTLGSSVVCPHEITRHKTKPIYGFQSHPEVSGEDGLLIIKNFLRMCHLIE